MIVNVIVKVILKGKSWIDHPQYTYTHTQKDTQKHKPCAYFIKCTADSGQNVIFCRPHDTNRKSRQIWGGVLKPFYPGLVYLRIYASLGLSGLTWSIYFAIIVVSIPPARRGWIIALISFLVSRWNSNESNLAATVSFRVNGPETETL